MLQPGPVRYGRIWHNLPLRVKAAVWLMLPVPLIALSVIGLGLVGIHPFQAITVAAMVLELWAGVWILESIIRSLRSLQETTGRILRADPLLEIRPHSWELNGVAENLESIAALLEQQRQAVIDGQEQIERMFQDAPLAYLETDRDGMVRRCNRSGCELLGRSNEELAGKHLWELLEPAAEPGTAAGESFNQEYARPDGTRLLLAIHEELKPQGSAGNAQARIRYTLVDVTERRLAAEKVVQCDRDLQSKDAEVARALAAASASGDAKARFLSNMSDELRVPLNGIIGFAELMFDGKIGAVSSEQRECLGDVLASARHLYQMVDDVLDLARGDSERPPVLRRETVDLEPLISDVRYVMEVLSAQKRRVRIGVEIAPEIRQVATDAAGFKQVVQGYVSYAVNHSPEGGQVAVRVMADGLNNFRLEVEHSSSGTGDEDQDEGRDQRYPGSDAGLSLARQLIEEQGGRVGLRSTPGRASLLYAILPTARGAETNRPPAIRILDGGAEERCARMPADGARAVLIMGEDGRKKTA
jgi:PAS domain S-box-containing protein